MFAVIYIPDFSLQAVLRSEPNLWTRPVALIDDSQTKAFVFQMTSVARSEGVAEGLTSTQAMARCSSVLIKSRSLAQEQTATDALLQTSYCFSPRIESTSLGICTVDLQGLPAFASGDATEASKKLWAEKIIVALGQLNLRAQIGIALSPDLALHAARKASPLFLVDNSADFVALLPIESLDPSFGVADLLRRWGIHTVGAFAALGKDKIAERLGPEGVELFERAAADVIRPLNLIVPSEHFAEAMDFEVEIESLQPLLFVLNRFIEQLSTRLTLAQFVAKELRLRLKLASGEKYEHVFSVPSPTANTVVLFRMLQTHLETVRTESSIVSLELSAEPTRAENYQFGLFETALRDPNQFSETLARLSALCGHENVGTPSLQETYRPDAFKLERPRFDAVSAVAETNEAQPSYGLRLRRFRPAFHADVELQNGEPTFISSLKVSSPIQYWSGPFRISGDWWDRTKIWSRDEWDIQTRDGTLYRIYRQNDDWFVEGVYD